MFLRKFVAVFLLFSGIISAQENFSAGEIPEALKENVSAVLRQELTDITIASRKSMTIKKTRVVTVFNENGTGAIDASEYFDNSTEIKSIEALIYDASGKEIKKIKRKDFKEVAVSGGSVITDNKLLYLDYIPVQYPFTIVFKSETQTTNTAFIPRWSPVEGAYVSTQKSAVTINYAQGLGFKYKEYNFEGQQITKQDNGSSVTFSATDVPAIKNEDYAPSYQKIVPYVIFGLEKFHLEGVDGEAATWESFGTWVYNNLLTGTDELTPETQTKIKGLVGNETDPLKKAKIVYEYVQGKTRYISIQLGIGGWKPMTAKDVDRLGYGDCKALSNYTRALLKSVGVESYYTIIYGDTEKRDILQDFVSMQGNHVILAIPNKGNYVWLECTSQSIPFGFQGDFTDNRMALLIKPDKGEIVKTRVFDTKGNLQVSKGNYVINENGGITGSVSIVSSGLQYDDKYTFKTKSPSDLEKIYKNRFAAIGNLKLKKTDLKNDADVQQFTEDIAVEADNYCSKSGDRVMFAVNAFNQSYTIPQRYRNRKLPFEIGTGFYDTDEVTITLPAGFTIEASPENAIITDKFGEYKAEYTRITPDKILYKRSLLINEGVYANSDYESYRQFREKIARNDNAKVVLVKK
jgi:hypothetical protein